MTFEPPPSAPGAPPWGTNNPVPATTRQFAVQLVDASTGAVAHESTITAPSDGTPMSLAEVLRAINFHLSQEAGSEPSAD